MKSIEEETQLEPTQKPIGEETPSGRSHYSVFTTIYRLKVLHVLTVLFLLAIACFKIDELKDSVSALRYIAFFPFKAFGEASLIAAVVGVTFELIVRREAERKLIELVNSQLDRYSEKIARLVTHSLLTDKKLMAGVLKPTEIESTIRKALELQYGENQLVTDIEPKVLRRLLSSTETWRNYRYKGALSVIDDQATSEEVRNLFYDIYIDLTYQTRLQKTEFLFTTARTIEEFNIQLQDPKIQECWLIPSSRVLPNLDARMFSVLGIDVNGKNLHIRKVRTSADKVSYICSDESLKSMLDKEVVVHYRYRSRINKLGHLFTVSPIYPTNGLAIELDFARTDIHYVNVLDFLSPNPGAAIRYTPPDRPHKIEVETNDWAFPKSGVTFVWVLEQEIGLSGRT